MKLTIKQLVCGTFLLFPLGLLTSCKEFVFFDVHIPDEDNPLVTIKTSGTSADLYEAPKVQEAIPNPDPEGAFNDWATCLVMFKEGHPHGNGKLHGNYVLEKTLWKQEQLVLAYNKPEGITVEVDKNTTVNYFEKQDGKEGPDYIRIVGGPAKLWALCIRFYNKEGELINNKILEQSDQYQIFFSISDVNDKGQPYDVMDLRYRVDRDGNALPAKPSVFFADKKTLDARRKATPYIFQYTYRDTWKDELMNDGARDLFNLKLLPPLNEKDFGNAAVIYDQDFVGLKGHLKFDYDYDKGPVDSDYQWPMRLSDGRIYSRVSTLLPQFYLSIQVMKCDKGKKTVITGSEMAEIIGSSFVSRSLMFCAPSYKPDERSEWKEVIRVNIPMKVFTSMFDSNPIQTDPLEPYFFHMAREFDIDPTEAYEMIKNMDPHDMAGTNKTWYL